jgi:hypothetical protein
MGHLTLEDLARLVDQAPDPVEERHLSECESCRKEVAALRAQTESLGALPDLRPPAGDWEALEARLAGEGLIRTSGLARGRPRWWASGWMQAAAAIVLFLGGTGVGSGVFARGNQSDLADGGLPEGLELFPVNSEIQPASNLADAADVLNDAEQRYMLALLQYRQILDAQEGPASVGDPTKRLAAIEAILAASSAAMQHAPADPYVNGVLVSALAEREGIIRNASLTPSNGIF